ncbi:MAG TPA: class I SAM-dependent methyltransferase [Bacteroidales bacterium]|nr:class I SAM-dependent methyltransferase [Bacteroidales bacterium]
MTTNFDTRAQEWDNDPMKVERAVRIAQEIMDFIQPNHTFDAFEFGCGTGLLSFQLKDAFNTITLVDSSEGMIHVLKEKIAKAGIQNFKPLHLDVFEHDLKLDKQDVIYTLMTLHHMVDLNQILKLFYSILKPGGYLCIADLVTEDGSFHAHQGDFDGHKGFDRKELGVVLSNNGFRVEYDHLSYEIEKKVGDALKKYPLFLMIGRKEDH